MTSKENPTFLSVEKGVANLAGKRRLTDDYEEATEHAEEIGGQVFALEPIEPAPYSPMPAVTHVQAVDPVTGLPWSDGAA